MEIDLTVRAKDVIPYFGLLFMLQFYKDLVSTKCISNWSKGKIRMEHYKFQNFEITMKNENKEIH